MAAAKQRRNYLTLDKKVEVIKTVEKNPGINSRSLAMMFDCGKTQIGKILKDKVSILALYESNRSGRRVHTSVAPRSSEYSEINEALYSWYLLATSKNIFPMGPQLVEKAGQIAQQLGKSSFKGSNGWLEKWKKRYNLKQLKISGESGDVRGETVDSWKERLPEIIAGYDKDNIWNMDETGVFFKALPDRGFGVKGKECRGGKKSKQRVTIAFFVTASGKKEKPIFIWKSENPRCLKRFNKSVLPVTYYSQKKAWMNAKIMESILTKLNNRFVSEKLLFMDNAGCHPEDLKSKFSNINICFLPANTTSKLQPLDLGIIMNFKVHYRKLFLQHVLARIDECDTATEVAKSVNILVAIRWVAKAWLAVKETTIRKCFRKAGVLDSTLNVASCDLDDEDPFLAVDEMALQGLIDQTMTGCDHCPLKEYVNGEDEVPVCMDANSETWEEDFFNHLGQDEDQDHEESDNEQSDNEQSDNEQSPDLEPPQPKLKTYKEAIMSLEDVQLFLESRGRAEEAMQVGAFMDTLSVVQIATAQQTTLHDYISH